MLQASKILANGQGLAPVLLKRAATLTLDWDLRQKSRFAARDSRDREIGVFLPRGTPLRGGDVLVAEDGSLVRVIAAPQPVLVITHCKSHGSPFDLLRAAYHLGNRHVAIELRPNHLKIEPDHVLADMLRGMHLLVHPAEEAFEPEAGAYAAHGAPTATPWARPAKPRPTPAFVRSPRSTSVLQNRAPRRHPSRTRRMRTTTAVTAIRTDADLLQLIWLASPALPVGGFSYSEGLEAAVEAGRVQDEHSVCEWLVDQMKVVLSRADLPVVAQALAAWRQADMARIAELDAWVLATRETSEMRLQSVQMGRSMLEWLKSVHPALAQQARQVPSYPVAFALAASQGAATPREVALCFAFGWAENMVQAAVRAVPLGQSAGQRILRRLSLEIPVAIDSALERCDATRQALAPMLAILSAQHESQYSRLFRS